MGRKGAKLAAKKRPTPNSLENPDDIVQQLTSEKIVKKLPPLKQHYTESDLHNTKPKQDSQRATATADTMVPPKSQLPLPHTRNSREPDKLILLSPVTHTNNVSKVRPKRKASDERSGDNDVDQTIEQKPGRNSNPNWSNMKKTHLQWQYERTLRNHLRRRDMALKKKQQSEFAINNTWMPNRSPKPPSDNTPKTQKTSRIKFGRKTNYKPNLNEGKQSPQTERVQIVVPKKVPPKKPRTNSRQLDNARGARIQEALIQAEQTSQSPTEKLKTPQLSEKSVDESKQNQADANDQKKKNSVSTPEKSRSSIKQINMSDFANLEIASKQSDNNPKPILPSDYQSRIKQIRHKGSNSENSSPGKTDSKPSLAFQLDTNAVLASKRNGPVKLELEPVVVGNKIENKSLLSPHSLARSSKFMDWLVTDSNSKELKPPTIMNKETKLNGSSVLRSHGSPIPAAPRIHIDTDDTPGEITLMVPQLPQINGKPSQHLLHTSSNDSLLPPRLRIPEVKGHTSDEEPIVTITNVDGSKVREDLDGLDSGYNSLTPRLSVTSQDRLATPYGLSSFHLGVPSMIAERSTTPFSSITTSTNIDMNHSRPTSSFLDITTLTVPSAGDQQRIMYDIRSPMPKLPAINSRASDCDENDDHRYEFTPLPILSVRTSDGEMSD